jgi:hypothetical protein
VPQGMANLAAQKGESPRLPAFPDSSHEMDFGYNLLKKKMLNCRGGNSERILVGWHERCLMSFHPAKHSPIVKNAG